MKTFEQNKTITELNIDPTRTFVVVDGGDNDFKDGDKLKLDRDDNSTLPFFTRISDGKKSAFHLYHLAYAEKTTLKDIEIGDIIVHENGSEAMVLDVREKVFCRSMWGDFKEVYCWLTYEEAEELGYKLKGQVEEEELTGEITITSDMVGKKVKVVKE